jgi:YVTN family beta-propeller protein
MKRTTIAALLSAMSVMAASGGFHATGKIQIGGEGGWDYVATDSAARRLYVSHATKVVVVDLDTDKVIGEIPNTQGVHGIAVAPELNRGYISNGRTNDVTVFDLKSLKEVGRVATGQNPDAILYEPHSKRVFTFNGRSKDSSVIDTGTDKVVATIPLSGRPEFSATDGSGKVWVNIEEKNEISEIDAANAKVTKTYPLEGCDEPSGLAIDAKSHHLFSVCGNKVMAVSDPGAGKVIAKVPIGQGPDAAGFDPTLGFAYSSNGADGTLTVARESGGKYEVVENATTQRGARTMAVDTKTHKIYLPTAQFGPAPAATQDNPRPRPSIVPGSFVVLIVSQ